MAKKYRQRHTAAQTSGPRDSAVVNTGTGSMFYLANGGFQSAGTSDSRGYIYWPTTDTRRQITTWTRFEVARKIQFLYNHFGFIRRLVNGMSRMLGYLTPQPDTSDEEPSQAENSKTDIRYYCHWWWKPKIAHRNY